jgi:hypothetical protein
VADIRSEAPSSASSSTDYRSIGDRPLGLDDGRADAYKTVASGLLQTGRRLSRAGDEMAPEDMPAAAGRRPGSTRRGGAR